MYKKINSSILIWVAILFCLLLLNQCSNNNQLKKQINSISKDLEKFRDQNLNLDDMQALDEYLGKIVDNATELGRVKKEGLPVAKLQTKLRDILNKAGKDDIIGGSEGLEALKRGRNLW